MSWDSRIHHVWMWYLFVKVYVNLSFLLVWILFFKMWPLSFQWHYIDYLSFSFYIHTGFTYSADLLAHSFMTYMLWPERSEQYLLLAHEADLSDELDEFNEAPHIINHSSPSLLTPMFDYDTEPLKINTWKPERTHGAKVTCIVLQLPVE